MKVQMLTDDKGSVLAIASEKSLTSAQKGDGPSHIQMVPRDGQRFWIMEIADELFHLDLAKIRTDYRVDLFGEPRLIRRGEIGKDVGKNQTK